MSTDFKSRRGLGRPIRGRIADSVSCVDSWIRESRWMPWRRDDRDAWRRKGRKNEKVARARSKGL